MKKMTITELNAKRAKLLDQLANVNEAIHKAGGNTYVIEYQALALEKKHAKTTIKNAIDENDAIRKWRRAYHAWDCQGCCGDYPIYCVYLKGNRPANADKLVAKY